MMTFLVAPTGGTSSSLRTALLAAARAAGGRHQSRCRRLLSSGGGGGGSFGTAAGPIESYSAARAVLGLEEKGRDAAAPTLDATELRSAYYRAARECHPDTQATEGSGGDADADSGRRFRLVAEAHEFLRRQIRNGGSGADAEDRSDTPANDVVTAQHQRDEEEYRRACLQWLGLTAETVEECKRCPDFGRWLSGRSDAAFLSNDFLRQHGGLAPRLSPRRRQQLTMAPPGAGRRRRRRRPDRH